MSSDESEPTLDAPPAAPPDEPITQRHAPSTLDWVRYVGCGAVVVVGGIFALDSDFERCATTTTTTGSEETVVEACSAPTATDLGVLVAGGALLALLWPEISEFGVPGLVTLKRRVRESEAKVDDQQHKQDHLETLLNLSQIRLDTLSQATASSTATAHNYFLIGADELATSPSRAEGKAEAFISGSEPPEQTEPTGAPAESATEDAADAIARQRVLELWESLALDLGLMGRTPARLSESSAWRHDREQFLRYFEEEVGILRAARNSIAHAQPLSPSEVRVSLQIAEVLTKAWTKRNEALPGYTRPPTDG